MRPKKQVAGEEVATSASRVAAPRQPPGRAASAYKAVATSPATGVSAASGPGADGNSVPTLGDPAACAVPRDRMVRAVDFWPLERVIPYPNNPRLHSDEEVRRLADFIVQVGFLKPIEVDEAGVILTGHRRRLAALVLGMPEVPVVQHTHLSEAEKRAYRVADNRLTLEGEWDEAALREEAEFMRDAGWDLEDLGFTDEEIEAALAPIEGDPLEGACDPDHVPEPAEAPISRPGDIWVMGEHRLLCGDSRDPLGMLRMLDGARVSLTFADAPYGMGYGGGRAKGDHVYGPDGDVLIKAHGPIEGDDLRGAELERLVGTALTNARVACAEGAAAYVCATWRTYASFERALAQAGLEIDACIVWNKGWIGLGHSHYRPQHEFILYSAGKWHAGADESDVWTINRDPAASYLHPTQKPVELIERCLLNSSAPGEAVLDPFTGSGSTLIASERRHRRFFGVEIAPEYADVAVRRWQEFTGRRAVHQQTGEPFPG